MYVCLCNEYRDDDLREAARCGALTATDAYLTLGSGPCCGRCLPTAEEIIEAEHKQSGSSTARQVA